VRYSRHGHPSAVLRVETVALDTSALRASDVLVRMVAAPVTALDVAQITGYAGAGAGPRAAGTEGLGVVEQAGASSGLKAGDVVVASKRGVGECSAAGAHSRGARRRGRRRSLSPRGGSARCLRRAAPAAAGWIKRARK